MFAYKQASQPHQLVYVVSVMQVLHNDYTLHLSTQLPVEVLTNVSMIVPVTVSAVTCVAVGGATRECGGGALPPVPTLVEGACQNVLQEVRGRCLWCRCQYSFLVLLMYIHTWYYMLSHQVEVRPYAYYSNFQSLRLKMTIC